MGAILAKVGGGLLGLIGKGVSAAAIVTGIYYVVLVALHLITDLLLRLGGVLIKSAISWNSDIINSTFVRGGHEIVLTVANMGFIVALVVIAFATMFRAEAFGYKKALPKLVIAALLINFGYFIVTKWLVAPIDQIIVGLTNAANFGETTFKSTFDPRGDFANIPTEAYSEDISGGEYLKGQDLPWETKDNPAIGEQNKATFLNSVPGFVQKIGAIAAGSLVSIAFAFIGIIALFAFAVMLFIRGIALSFLIILLPLAWIAWIFPKLKIPGGGNPWTMWWENFTRWLLFGPFAIFFLWLAIQLTKGPLPSAEGGIGGPATAVGGMIAVVGFMIGGLIVANKMGITGAGYALGIAAAGKVWAQGKIKDIGVGGLHRIFKQGAEDEENVRPWMQKALELGKKTTGWKKVLTRPAGAPIRVLARKALQATDTLEEARKKAEVAKVRAEAPYRQQQMLKGLSDFGKYAATEDLLDRGYGWEEDLFWELVTAAGLDPGKLMRLGHRRLDIKLGDAGFRPGAVAAVKPLADFEKPIRDRIEKEMRGKPEEEIEKAIQDEFEKPENAARIAELQRQIEWPKTQEMKKMLNILKTNEIPKMEKRIWSDWHGWYGNRSRLAHEAYSGNLRAVISMDRPQGMSGARNNSRGDGVVNWDITAEQGIQRENRYLVRTLMRARGVAPTDTATIRTIETDVEGMSSKQKLEVVEKHPAEVAATIKAIQIEEAEKMIDEAIDIKTGRPLSTERREVLKVGERERITSMRDEDVAALAGSRIQGLYRVRRGGLLLSTLIAEEAG